MSQNDADRDVEQLDDELVGDDSGDLDAEAIDVEDGDDLDDTDPLDDRYPADEDESDVDESDDDEDDDEFDDLDDASDDEIDLVVAMYREDGNPVVVSMPKDLANDLDELITQLRRLPADGGAIGMVSIASEFFVICRARGRNVQVLLSDGVSANDWPIARDVADFLGVEIPDPDDDSEPVGDLGLLADQGISDFDLEGYATDLDEDSDELLARIADRMKLGSQFRHAVSHPHR